MSITPKVLTYSNNTNMERWTNTNNHQHFLFMNEKSIWNTINPLLLRRLKKKVWYWEMLAVWVLVAIRNQLNAEDWDVTQHWLAVGLKRVMRLVCEFSAFSERTSSSATTQWHKTQNLVITSNISSVMLGLGFVYLSPTWIIICL